MPWPEIRYSHSSAFGCRWMSCFEPGGNSVMPKTECWAPTESRVNSQRTSMSTQPSSARRTLSRGVLSKSILNGCSLTRRIVSDMVYTSGGWGRVAPQKCSPYMNDCCTGSVRRSDLRPAQSAGGRPRRGADQLGDRCLAVAEDRRPEPGDADRRHHRAGVVADRR